MKRVCDEALTWVLQFLGKRWKGVFLATLTNGSSGFAELKRCVNGNRDSVLSERLSELQSASLVVRSVESGPRVAVTNSDSDAGATLLAAMDALMVWSLDNSVRHEDPPTESPEDRIAVVTLDAG